MPKKDVATVVSIDDLRGMLNDLGSGKTHTRVIDREGQAPLTVTLRDLTVRQTNEIPYGMKVPLTDAFGVIWRYILDWDLTLVNAQTGKEIAVPVPSAWGEEQAPEVLELLDSSTAALLVTWLKAPHAMESVEQKKSLTPSEPTPAP